MVLAGVMAGLTSPLDAVPRIDHEAQCTYKKLTWDDFRGPVIRGQQVAWIATSVVLDPYEAEVVAADDDTWVARVKYPGVYALMDKLRSGAGRGNRTVKNLAHEQTHFDLAEYHARKLALEVREITVTGGENSRSLISELETKVLQAYDATAEALNQQQARYDRETRHGLRKKEQRKWQRLAEQLLAETPAYELR